MQTTNIDSQSTSDIIRKTKRNSVCEYKSTEISIKDKELCNRSDNTYNYNMIRMFNQLKETMLQVVHKAQESLKV